MFKVLHRCDKLPINEYVSIKLQYAPGLFVSDHNGEMCGRKTKNV